MKLSALNKKIESLQDKRKTLDDQLNATIGSDSLSARKAVAQETAIRGKITNLDAELAPLKMERGEIDRMVKGKPRKQAASYLSEEVTLG